MKPIIENIFFSNSSQALTNSKLSILEVSENTIIESKEDNKLDEETVDIYHPRRYHHPRQHHQITTMIYYFKMKVQIKF